MHSNLARSAWLLALALALPLSLDAAASPAPVRPSITAPRAAHDIDTVRRDAMERYHASDHRVFVELMEAVAQQSGDEVDIYNLACGYALAGHPQEAMQTLQYLADRGSKLIEEIDHDPDFHALRGMPEFHELIAWARFNEGVQWRLDPLRDLALERYRAQDHDGFVRIMERVARFSTQDVDIYNLACGYALVGRTDEALAQLEILADRGIDYGVASDSDFDGMRADPRFQDVAARIASAAR